MNYKIVITSRQYGCVCWNAVDKTTNKVICSGATDNPITDKERKEFIEEVKQCVNYSLGLDYKLPYESNA